MNSKYKHTPGPVTIEATWLDDEIAIVNRNHSGDDWDICTVHSLKANAELIAEAFNVSTETGLTPRQLAEQRAELLEVCQKLVEYDECGSSLTRFRWHETLEAARAAIAKATGGDV